MKIWISAFVVLIVLQVQPETLFGEKAAKKGKDVYIEGTYSASGVRTHSSVKKLTEKRPHEFDGTIQIVLGSVRGGMHHLGYQLHYFHLNPDTKQPSVLHLVLGQRRLYHKDLLKKGNDIAFQCQTSFLGAEEGEIFRLPDNTEWKVAKVNLKKKEVHFEVKAIPKTVDPRVKKNDNNRLIVPLNSEVTFHVSSLFGRPQSPALYSSISIFQPEGRKSDKFKLVVKGHSHLEDKPQGKVIKNKEYENIKTGQKIELIPGQWHIIKRFVKADPKKKTRGWIEFDTTPASSVK